MSTPISEGVGRWRPVQIDAPGGTPILTAAEVRSAEQALFDAGISAELLMERAGAAVAEIVATRFPHEDVLVGCGPGNNGGDGYVIARLLRERGFEVRVAALGEPRTPEAKAARARWAGPVEPIEGCRPRPAGIFVDALFGTGQRRPLGDDLATWLDAAGVGHEVAVDLPSGVDADTGALLGASGSDRLTVAIGALKPAHLLAPGALLATEVVLAPIGLPVAPGEQRLTLAGAPGHLHPDRDGNKYTRGKVVVIGGAMAGAANLAAMAAQRSGAGYVELAANEAGEMPPHALVRRKWSAEILADARVNCVAIGPGLADDAAGEERLRAALALDRPVVVDAGALTILKRIGLDALNGAAGVRLLTPHRGEFERLFGPLGDDPLAAARDAAARSGALVLLKGPATIVATPDGRAVITPPASSWLATAGTGDVLTGICATMLAQRETQGADALEAVAGALWLHARAADHAGPALIADDLVTHLPAAIRDAL